MTFPNASESDFATLRLKRDGTLLQVTIDSPPLNMVDDALHTDICRLIALLKHETEARAVLITGAGRAFCAGADFEWLQTMTGERLVAMRHHAKQLVWDFLDVEVPIVAAVNGPAIGFGASLALLCDIIFMAESAVIADPHAQVGVVPGDGGMITWPLSIGPAKAKEFLMTGDRVSAADAERMGLVNHAVADGELLDRATAFAQRLADSPPLSIQGTKVCVNKLVKDAANLTFDTSTALELLTFHSEDYVEAVAALREKRAPTFHGR